MCDSILAAGLGDYYRHRSVPTGRAADPLPDELVSAGVYDLPAVQEGFVSALDGGECEASLTLDGIACAACAWLIERQLQRVDGVAQADVNFATHRARVRYDPQRTTVSALLAAVHGVGYAAYPYDPARAERELEAERRRRLRDLGLAGVLGVQIMMLALASYLGEWSGMETGTGRLLDFASLVLAVPVVFVCARPFLDGAWRALRARSLGMDVPVSLAILVAFTGSVQATVSGHGAVYYDSVAMFTFLLLLARYGEFAARRHALAAQLDTLHALPSFARRLVADGGERMVPVAALEPGDRVLVRPGETVPADGRVESGHSSVDEALLSGESHPRVRVVGDLLVGGSVNVESPLTLVVDRVGRDTVLSGLLELAERAREGRPRMARLADRVASVFVLAVLLSALAIGVWWWQTEPARVLPVVVALLVATCPCALSLAMPTALSAGAGALSRIGLLPTRADVIEGLAAVDHVMLDKTGTLTLGQPRLVATLAAGTLSADRCLALAAALERVSEHPLARALGRETIAGPVPTLGDIVNRPGAGLEGRWCGEVLWLGSPAWVSEVADIDAPDQRIAELGADGATVTLLARRHELLALLVFEDTPREGADELIESLRAAGVGVTLASGDAEPAVRRLAERLRLDDWHAGLRPNDKLALLRELQGHGRRVAVLGDGINDVPVLAGADVSVAMQGGADVAHARADALLLVDRLPALALGLRVARATRAVMRQNLVWAVTYNLLVLPLAATGVLTPWMAAIGMSASSLVVVGNASRARRAGRERRS